MAIEHRDELVARVDDADRALIRGDPELHCPKSWSRSLTRYRKTPEKKNRVINPHFRQIIAATWAMDLRGPRPQ